jgi:hypothetical protein
MGGTVMHKENSEEPDSSETTEDLRQQAKLLAIAGHERMTDEQLRTAVTERRRGADPQQAETVARNRH